MTTVSREKIVEVWDRLCELDEPQTGALVQQFMQEQPALGLYLYANNETLGAEAEHSPMIDLVMACWQAMTETAGKPLRSVSPDEIEKAEEANTQALEKLEESSEIEWERVIGESLATYNQVQLLGCCLEILMSGNEDTPELASENIGMELLWLRTVIDCLDQ